MLRAGIVGLPNVGKSTLFNALTATKNAQSANYPFCTIEPNVGVVVVPDERLQILSDLCKAKEIIPTVIEFVDIAGLVKGASQGEGLGNQFLHNIRAVSYTHLSRTVTVTFCASFVAFLYSSINRVSAGVIRIDWGVATP